MKIGMLWYDGTKRPLEERIQECLSYYQKKYTAIMGEANTCNVHPSLLEGKKTIVLCGINLISDKELPANHFWIGKV